VDGIKALAAAQNTARNGSGPAPLEDVAPKTLAEVMATFERWLYLPDTGALEFVLATVAANRLPQDPVWGLVVGPPSSGKTELVMSTAKLPNVHLAATLSEAALLSGSPKKDRAAGATGGLLRQIGEFGILLHKDFTSILSMHRDARAAALGALREIFDGSWTRPLGADGGRVLHWEGKAGLLAGCTQTIDSHHSVMATMGDRFLLYRVPPVERQEQAKQGLRHGRSGAAMRRELAEAVAGLFAGIPEDAAPRELSDEDTDRLIVLADLTTAARSAIERDGFSREIELVPDMEAPARLAKQLRCALDGLDVIGSNRSTAWRIVTKASLDSIPAVRLAALNALLAEDGWLTTTAVENAIRYPNRRTMRTLEDLLAHGLLERDTSSKPYKWRLGEHTASLMREARGSTEMSGEAQEPPFQSSESGALNHPHRIDDDFSVQPSLAGEDG
jgi:hypothetical protein